MTRVLLLLLVCSAWFCQAPRIDVIVECLSSAECSAGAVCRNGACLQCSEDADCDGGRHCDAGRCVECTRPDHCGGDALCRAGTCYYTLLPLTCSPGTERCQGRLLQVCSDDGSTWATREECSSAPLCQTLSEGRRKCLEPSCSEGALSCFGPELRRCNADRTDWDAVATCETAAHCDPGATSCRDRPCEPAQLRCNTGRLERCNELRDGWALLEQCASQELCEATRFGADAASAPPACAPPHCAAGEWRCSAEQLQACSEGRTGWELIETCATAYLCQAGRDSRELASRRTCARPQCAPGEHRCTEEGVLEVCSADRGRFVVSERCAGPAFCNAVAANNGGPGCDAAPCEPGEMQCNGNLILLCSDDVTGFAPVLEACDTPGLCNDDDPRNAYCQVPACRRGPGSDSEFVCDGSSLLRCNEQHTGYEPFSTCASADLCSPLGCLMPVCVLGETRCSGNAVQRCSEGRTGFETVTECPSEAPCDGTLGACREPVDAGARDAGSGSDGSD